MSLDLRDRVGAEPVPSPTPDEHASGVAGHVLALARWSARHRWRALGLWLLFVVAAVVVGGMAGTKQLTPAQSGSGESGKADRVVERAGFPPVVTEHVLVQPRSGRAEPAEVRAAVTELTAALKASPHVRSVEAPVASSDGRSTMVSFTVDVGDATSVDALAAADETVPQLLATTASVAKDHPGLRVEEVGDASLDKAIGDVVSHDFSKAERLSLPITLLILLLAFGALLAAGVPVLLALSAVASAIGLSALVSHVSPVTQTLNSVVLLIGMAVGVDYSLFYVRRAREERARGAARRDAIEIAARTSGRAVLVSAVAVVVAMSGLMLSGNAVFASMAIGTIIVVAVAALGSLTVVPALLAILGDKVERPRVPFLHRLRRADGGGRMWPVVMRRVLAKPVVSVVVAGGALVALALPVVGMKTGETGPDALPRSIPVMQSYDRLTAAFPQVSFAHRVVVWSDQQIDRAKLDAASAHLVSAAKASGQFTGLDAVTPQVSPDGTVAYLDLPVAGSFEGPQAERSLDLLRGSLVPVMKAELGTEAGVSGPTAGTRDWIDRLHARLPIVIGFVLALTFVALVLAFRSVVVAATAVVLNLLSVGAAYGVLVLVFQHTWAESLLGFHSMGAIVDWLPLFLFVVLFGLSMDYHVFVVSRIREAHDKGLPTRAAVAQGVTQSAGVVTSAAAVMGGVFGIFGSLSLLEFKQMGVGLAVAVLIDATVVRAVLLPATMAVLGRANWWLPAWLDRALPEASAH